jgi:hypothetical protein
VSTVYVVPGVTQDDLRLLQRLAMWETEGESVP